MHSETTLVVTMCFNEATQDYKLMVFFILGFFEDHEGTNETDYGINVRILY
ncbi:429_t:CDS:2 [Funneliformis geosporum]|nr:429_t:CDS:2 [Funneliformis geosporum]